MTTAAYVGAHRTKSLRWDLDAAGQVFTFPRRVRDDGLARRVYRQRHFALRKRVTSYMLRHALRQMNRYYAATGDRVGALDVVGEAELLAVARAADRHGILDAANAGAWLVVDDAQLVKCARTALRYALRDWTPDFIETASLAGRISKRPRAFTPAMYLDVQHMTQARAAAALGCSVSTIKRLKALADAVGGAIKAAALVFATRVKRLYPDVMGRVQITRERAVLTNPADMVERPLEGRSPP